jgi:hypothetical protein
MTITNLEAAEAVLAAHREARQWTDAAVAADLVAQLGLDPAGEAKNAKPVVMPGITEDEVIAHETAAKEAADKAKAARDALNAQKAEAAKPAADAAAQVARDETARVGREREATQRTQAAAAQRAQQAQQAAQPEPDAPRA